MCDNVDVFVRVWVYVFTHMYILSIHVHVCVHVYMKYISMGISRTITQCIVVPIHLYGFLVPC